MSFRPRQVPPPSNTPPTTRSLNAVLSVNAPALCMSNTIVSPRPASARNDDLYQQVISAHAAHTMHDREQSQPFNSARAQRSLWEEAPVAANWKDVKREVNRKVDQLSNRMSRLNSIDGRVSIGHGNGGCNSVRNVVKQQPAVSMLGKSTVAIGPRAGRQIVTDADIKNITKTFDDEKTITTYGPIGEWDVSRVTDMSSLFEDMKTFNEDISLWDVSNVKNMSHMFSFADKFNQPLDKWKVRNVEDMSHMFSFAKTFNQPLEDWDVSNVKDMTSMFEQAFAFNQPLDKWDVSKVEDMSHMFEHAKTFNQPLKDWDVSNVKNMNSMFNTAKAFNQSLNNWNVSKVEDMRDMFTNASAFNQSVDKWNVTKDTKMSYMFHGYTHADMKLPSWYHPEQTSRLNSIDGRVSRDIANGGGNSVRNVVKQQPAISMFGKSTVAIGQHAEGAESIQGGTQGGIIKPHLLLCHDTFKRLAINVVSTNTDDVELLEIDWKHFDDGFPNLKIEGQLTERKSVTILINFATPNIIFEQIAVIQALVRMRAPHIHIILPYFSVGTMERVSEAGEIATAKTMATLLSIPIGITGQSIITIYDIHALQEEFYFEDTVSVQLQSAMSLLINRISEMDGSDQLAIVFPDDGAAKRFKPLMKGFDQIVCAKKREGDKRVVTIQEGYPEGKHCIIIDDLVQSGGTLVETALALKSRGAPKVSCFVTHAVFPNNKWEHFLNSAPDTIQEENKDTKKMEYVKNKYKGVFEHFWITDSVPHNAEAVTAKQPFEVLSLAPLIRSLITGMPLELNMETIKYEDLSSWLKHYNVLIEDWGQNGKKSVQDLRDEILKGECTLRVEYGRVLRCLSAVKMHIFSSERPTKYLIKASQDKNGQINPKGNIQVVKLYHNEDLIQAAKRGLKEEMQKELVSEAIFIRKTNEKKEGDSYPNLSSLYTFHEFEMFVNDLEDSPFQTTEEDKTIYWAWRQIVTDVDIKQNVQTFNKKKTIRTYGPIGEWDVSRVTVMSTLFEDMKTFNEDISHWDVRNVTNMEFMFLNACLFDKPLNNWDVSNVINMNCMFMHASAFNQSLDKWDVSKVTDMISMFQGARAFSQSIDEWKVSQSANTLTFMDANKTLPRWYRHS